MRICISYKLSFNFILILGYMLLLASCQTDTKEIDVSHIELDLEISRFEQDLAALHIDSLDQQLPEMEQKYGEFFTLFAAGMINVGRKEDPSFNTSLMGFVNDPQINEVVDEVSKSFLDLNDLENEVEEAFKHYMVYFPGKPVPKVVTYISGFNASLAATDNTLGIGLDMYLGTESKYYQMLMLPQYKIENMTREMILPDCMRGWITSEYEADQPNGTLLSKMIEQGKVLYFLDLIIPKTEDRYKIGFTEAQLLWCKNSEAQMWAHLVDQELLYSTDFTQIIKYVGEAPFTVGFPEGSPGRTGWWIGWQIVKAYMDKNEGVSLPELMEMKDAQQILSKSNYKPNR